MSSRISLQSRFLLAKTLAVSSCRSGVSAIEFGLLLPLFLGFALSGFEMCNLLITTLKVQRLATMSADLVAQRGASERRLSELQMYDILSAMDVAAQPLSMRENGRMIVTAIVGEDNNRDGVGDVNRIKWQRFTGGRVLTVPSVGCHKVSTVGTIRNNRKLGPEEAMFHVQVTYTYQPLVGQDIFMLFSIPETITRFAAFRGRGGVFQPILSVPGYPPLEDCNA